MADIGEPQKEVQFEPLPEEQPVTTPAAPAPAEQPDLVPA
ncbi:MAG: hypothetical protein JWP11_1315 [Frankiales bacterium]|nr:hypothetical protein [Frankiales bacterium]